MKLIQPTDGEIILTKEERTILKNACNVLEEIGENLEELKDIRESSFTCEDSSAEEGISQIENFVDFITGILKGWHYCSVEESEE